MKLQSIRLFSFQSFGPEPTELTLNDITYLIGPNGSGKTAALQALCRLFAFDPSLRRIRRSDFHVPYDEEEVPEERQLWIEADFIFPELEDDDDVATIAPHFGHMRLDSADGPPRVRYRLDATMGVDGDIEETLVHVLDLDADGSPLTTAQVTRAERNHVQVHYLPARRDPADHIAYSANALLGRMLRAVNWENEREEIKGFTDKISESLAGNPSIATLSESLQTTWSTLHKGSFFADPQITFVASEIEALLRHLSVSFSPGHDEELVDFSRLSDGQKSMLYLSLVLSAQSIGRAVLAGDDDTFDPDKLRPPVFTIVALEEPENSLSPHYLGRIVNALVTMTSNEDAQALIATHAPSMLRRVNPRHIRYLRLTSERTTKTTRIRLPKRTDEAHKFVREAVQAYPEIYFSRLVILGEGDSEEIVLPRILRAKGIPVDESAVTVAPLGGRHVNHFWRLLSALEIPYLTLLDLDVARYQGGWGRFKYANDQLLAYHPEDVLPKDHNIPAWNSDKYRVREYPGYIEAFEERGVFFSYPMDLDFAMLLTFPDEYGVEPNPPSEATIKAVLGDSHFDAEQYDDDERTLFGTYHKRFKLGSKPATHIDALAQLSDEELLDDMPESLARLADAVIAKLEELPE
ncbi:chromosome segregation protein SMC [Vreelandella aquamarina]|jgi:energy-coupling factor transporter ATP-binding protein EcfA2|uniref:Chromosome segregation protein SMC n=1 Tax=Vreelandella aquamarina TaxID=77097 RepID=A0A6F8XFY0_9GAMM|nr:MULTISPECIES: AAA family ATPase [Oceanospirillales]MAP34417.1 ATP-dependent endonuclease [Halomonas sp.]MBI46625.1 ATP-dependent endonuclease [Marinobacter sp.]MBS97598.1 ATP-dependent endonuclease [Oceanospirillaceae bacterium]MCE7524004.1 AAA family ATPase [Alloalcanivorax xenomutans]BCB72819.1 chromosome segregation protein SMC [Halomonas meridiana]|tara:strand:- start:3205 stop:5109 length:1905 start_codon:yes stop_codon:yes gene_type:complete